LIKSLLKSCCLHLLVTNRQNYASADYSSINALKLWNPASTETGF